MESRRAFLGSLVATAATAALAGCTSGPDGSDGGGQSTDSPTEEPMDSPTEEPMGSGTDADATVTVGPGGSLSFEPKRLEVDVGATVAFVWDSGGHTVTVESQPDGANWTATGQETKSAGFTHTHTFDVAGQYDYVCVPHEGAGMVGTVLVGARMETETANEATPTPTPTPTPTSGGGGGDGGGGGGYY